MSCPTGIRPNEEVKGLFARCKDGKHRLIKLVIKDEELQLSSTAQVKGSIEEDVARDLGRLVGEVGEPCYFLLLLDSGTRTGSDWLLGIFSPDSAPIRAKMLLAGTRATLKTEFGAAYVKEEWHCASDGDASLEGWRRRCRQKAAPAPMTEIEAELNAVRLEEAEAKKAAMARSALPSQTLRGVAFPVDGEAEEKLRALKEKELNYVQLSVDTLNEAIKLEKAANLSVPDLPAQIPRNKPRYHFFRWEHKHEDRLHDSVLFIYSMPSGGCTIKERMLYSSCKGPFLETVARFLGLPVDRKVEMDANEAVNEDWLRDQLHPKIGGVIERPSFAKPKGPPGRGAPRMIQPQTQ